MKVTEISGLSERMRSGIFEHVFSAGDREVAGVLIGEYFDDGSLWIKDHIRAEDADERVAAVTFTHDSWDKILRIKDSEHPDSEIIGWYHSHPGYGLFLSGDDMFIHQNFFPAWWQIAYVVDPVNQEGGLFVWEDGEMIEFERHEASLEGPGRVLREPQRRASSGRLTGQGPGSLASLPREVLFGAAVVLILLIALLIALVPFGNGNSTGEETAIVQPERQSKSSAQAGSGSDSGEVIDQFPSDGKGGAEGKTGAVPVVPTTPVNPSRKQPGIPVVPGGSSGSGSSGESSGSGSSGGSGGSGNSGSAGNGGVSPGQ